MYKTLEELPEEQLCKKRTKPTCHTVNTCSGVAKLTQKTNSQALYLCGKCKSEWEYQRDKETNWWIISQGNWQDINRTYTNVERVYATMWDCSIEQREAA